MIDVLLFHHALGLTEGVTAFADELRAADHRVVTPDLFDGVVFDSVTAGVAHAEGIGFGALIERGIRHTSEVADRFSVIGFSLGALPAQKLAQTHDGVAAAVLCFSAIPLGEFANAWPAGVGLQVHIGEEDELATEDLAAAKELTAQAPGELFLYPGPGHLIVDVTSADYHREHATQILARTKAFLADCSP